MKKPLVKAYKNTDFLKTPDARTIRVLCELTEPQTRLHKNNVEHTLVFFGSSRIKPRAVSKKNLVKIEKLLKKTSKPGAGLIKNYEEAKSDLYMSQYYEKARKLAFKLTKWIKQTTRNKNRLVLCTGGGEGIMEAINRGAHEAKGKSIGLNISLPKKQSINKFVSSELAFEFHYFFIRKFWFAYLAKALVIFPGGFGTMDEMMEILTLVQTGIITKKMPIIIFGREYWEKILNFEEMIKSRTIDKHELDSFIFFDDVDKAFNFLKKRLKSYII